MATKAQKEAEAKRRAALTDEEREAEDAGASESKNSVTVTYQGGKRVYSKEIHGADYEDLAEEFATKKGGKVA